MRFREFIIVTAFIAVLWHVAVFIFVLRTPMGAK
jgi:hypothetical protein